MDSVETWLGFLLEVTAKVREDGWQLAALLVAIWAVLVARRPQASRPPESTKTIVMAIWAIRVAVQHYGVLTKKTLCWGIQSPRFV